MSVESITIYPGSQCQISGEAPLGAPDEPGGCRYLHGKRTHYGYSTSCQGSLQVLIFQRRTGFEAADLRVGRRRERERGAAELPVFHLYWLTYRINVREQFVLPQASLLGAPAGDALRKVGVVPEPDLSSDSTCSSGCCFAPKTEDGRKLPPSPPCGRDRPPGLVLRAGGDEGRDVRRLSRVPGARSRPCTGLGRAGPRTLRGKSPLAPRARLDRSR
jgi:hypothetical protein